MLIRHLANQDPIGVVFIPGFLNEADEFLEVAGKLDLPFSTYLVDLFSDYSETKEITYLSFLESLVDQLDLLPVSRVILVGYSLGARLAVGCYLKKPDHYCGLFLESFNPGIVLQQDRETRFQQDQHLADEILNIGLKEFLVTWYQNPIFSLNLKEQAQLVEAKLSFNPRLVAKVLRELSVGRMPSYWEDLATISCPVKLLSGQLDSKFSKIAFDVQKIINNSELVEAPKTGHNIHSFQSGYYSKILREFCKTCTKDCS